MLPLPPASTGEPGERRGTGEIPQSRLSTTLGLRAGIPPQTGGMPLYTRAAPKALEETRAGEAEPLVSWAPVARGATQGPQARTVLATAPEAEVGVAPTAPVVLGLGVTVLWSGSDNA